MALNRVQAILLSILNRIQEIENAIAGVLAPMSDKTLASFNGDFLAKVGKLVGELPGGRSDNDYRNAIRIRIRVNRSRGMATDVLAVAQLANTTPGAPPATYFEFGLGFVAFEVDIQQLPSPYWVGVLLGEAKPVGVYGVLGYTLVSWTGHLFGDSTTLGTNPLSMQFGDSVGGTGPVRASAQMLVGM